MSYEKVFTNNDFNDYVNGGAGGSVANWAGVRYIFLDGDLGDDNQAGYLDAPAGTVFTAPQVFAVAVKTTHRVNQIRAQVGAGHSVVVLVKPRAGGVLYDFLVPGDGLGSEDRSPCDGYGLMITRGSDLTNSPADRSQLAFRTAIPGPNLTGSFDIASAVLNPDYTLTLSLTGAVLPLGWILTRYRLKLVRANGSVEYAAAIWGDFSAAPDPTVVNSRVFNGPLPTVADKIFIEEPAVALYSFTEASGCSAQDRQAPFPLRTYGIAIEQGTFKPTGDATPGNVSHFSGIHVRNGGFILGGSCMAELLQFDGNTYDETGASGLGGNVALWAPADSYLTGQALRTLFLDSVSLSSSDQALPIGAGCQLGAEYVRVTNSALQQSGTSSTWAADVILNGLLVGLTSISTAGHTIVQNLRHIPYWGSGVHVSPLTGVSNAKIDIDTVQQAWGPEPSTPGFVFRPGAYVVRFGNLTNPLPGDGARIVFDNLTPDKLLQVDYSSLMTTGFEVEGGIKVICNLPRSGYPDDLLPCPRGKIMQFIDAEGGGLVLPAGTVVGPAVQPNTFDVTQYGIDSPPTGVLLTSVTQNGVAPSFGHGYAVVSTDQAVVVAVRTGTVDPGAKLYLSATDPGFAVITPTPIPLGRALPVGPRTPSPYYFIEWDTGQQNTEISQLAVDLPITNDAAYAPVLGFSVPVGPDTLYKFEALISVDAGAGGTKFCLTSAILADVLHMEYHFVIVGSGIGTGLVLARVFSAFGDPAPVNAVAGVANGYWRVTGSLKTQMGSNAVLQVAVAQETANAAATTIRAGSYLSVTRQG